MQYTNGRFFADSYARLYIPPMAIGDRLDKAMAAAGIMSQSELARKSGVPQATISRILKGGGAKGPETETIRKLANACGVTFDYLNEGGDKDAPAVTQRHAANDDNITADEIIELLQAYRDADPKDRRVLMSSAKTAAARSARRSKRSPAIN